MKRILLIIFLVGSVTVSLQAKKEKTIITGDKMSILKGGKTVVYSGNSKARRGNRTIFADKIVQDKVRSKLKVSGNVSFKGYSKEGELIQGRADRGWFLLRKERGELVGRRAHLVYDLKTSSSPLSLAAKRINFDLKKEQVKAYGNVEVVSSSMTAHSPQLVFSQKNNMLVLEKDAFRPKIVYKQDDKTITYHADTIIGSMDTRKLKCVGNAVGVFEFKE